MRTIDDLKYEMVLYIAHLHTSLEIVVMKGGRFSDWLRDNRPHLQMAFSFMLASNLLYAYFATSTIYDKALIAIGRLRWYQGQQKSLIVAQRLLGEAHDAMMSDGWYRPVRK